MYFDFHFEMSSKFDKVKRHKTTKSFKIKTRQKLVENKKPQIEFSIVKNINSRHAIGYSTLNHNNTNEAQQNSCNFPLLHTCLGLCWA